jgi:aminodeoxyfutalosine synthase
MNETTTSRALEGLERKVSAGESLNEEDARRVLTEVDLVAVGMLGESARRLQTQDVITYGRVCLMSAGEQAERGAAGELRVLGRPASAQQAADWVRRAAEVADGVPVTGFSMADLADLAGGDETRLREMFGRLRDAGQEAVAEVPVDRFSSADTLLATVTTAVEQGLGAWRLTVDRADPPDRLGLLLRAERVQQATGSVRAFAPLPRLDAADRPATGYDDVRTIAAARLVCGRIAAIQVDWPLYGPKLAQVALAFGANDIDGIEPVARPDLGSRRAPAAEIERQIRAAAGEPVERNGRYERRS